MDSALKLVYLCVVLGEILICLVSMPPASKVFFFFSSFAAVSPPSVECM